MPALTSSADAALPTRNTTYKGDVVEDSGIPATIKIYVGPSRTKIEKIKVVVDCGDSFDKLVIKDVAINDQGRFVKSKGLQGQVEGKFQTRNKATGKVLGDLCSDFFDGDYTAD